MDDTPGRPATCRITIEVNGTEHTREVAPRIHLVDFLREDIGLRTVRAGCEHGVCGSCTVRLDGDIVRGCLVLAVQADGCGVETIDAASDRGDVLELQHAFHVHNALQCGFCTSGMLFTASALLDEKPDATRAEVREYMSGNYCRCTGYHAITDAICEVLEARRERAASLAIGADRSDTTGASDITARTDPAGETGVEVVYGPA